MCVKRTVQSVLRDKRSLIKDVYDTHIIITAATHSVLFNRVLVSILKPQPQWSERIQTIRSFRVVRGKKNRAFAMCLRVLSVTNRWVTVSWRASILSEFPRTKLQSCPIVCALRQSVRRQVCTFRRRSVNVQGHLSCQLCSRSDGSTVYHVDHAEPTFSTLVTLFLSKEKNRSECPEPSAIQYGRNGRRVFSSSDRLFARRWCTFHQNHAMLRILCRTCNLGRKR